MSLSLHHIGIVGTGVMGAGIAQIAAQAGYDVWLFDSWAGAAGTARDKLIDTLHWLAGKGKMTSAAADAAISHLNVVDTLDQIAHCDLVIEAIVEHLEAKHTLFAELESIVAQNAILATNTSSLSVTSIAAGLQHPNRVAGFHFFNPVPLMKVIEVIGGMETDPAVVDELLALAKQLGHTGVRAKDTPGFIVNHAGRAYGTEGLKILEECVTTPAEIDRILREGAGFRMGPLELFDLTGMDVSHPAMESIYAQFYHDPRYRPSYLSQQRLTGNRLGRKTGMGFYRYEDGKRVAEPQPTAPPRLKEWPPVWVGCDDPDTHEQVTTLLSALGCHIETGELPGPTALCLLVPLGEDAASACVRFATDPARSVCLDSLVGLERHRTVMLTPVTRAGIRDAAHAMLSADGVGVSVIRDSVGFVAQRVLATVVNLACEIAQRGIATPQDIDNAVRLGLNYPRGPLQWGDELGPQRLLSILERMGELTGDPRYRPSPWLRRRAILGVSLLQPEPKL